MKANTEFIRDLQSLIAKEAGRYKVETLLETDYTVARVAKEQKLSELQSRKVLEELTRQGHFTKIKVTNPNGGAARMAYRPVEKKG